MYDLGLSCFMLKEYIVKMKNLRFCLYMCGMCVYSLWLIEFMFFGCVSVIFVDDYELLFSWFVDWLVFLVMIFERDF